jgi:peroxiredoxin (alkyl hydroperoxide reductase subunit C)
LWVAHLEEIDYRGRGKQVINFPVIEDNNKTASKLYGMLHEPVSSNKDIRGVFIIDPENMVRSINFYPMQVGRNMDEIVRLVEALQTVDQTKVLTPANWKPGEDVMVPYHPYTKEQLAANPELKDEYYSMGNRMWFKKIDK